MMQEARFLEAKLKEVEAALSAAKAQVADFLRILKFIYDECDWEQSDKRIGSAIAKVLNEADKQGLPNDELSAWKAAFPGKTAEEVRRTLDQVGEHNRVQHDYKQVYETNYAALQESKKELDQLKRERDEAQKLLDEALAKIPTTAQAMVYQSLLNKYEALERKCAEKDAALRQVEQCCADLANWDDIDGDAVKHALSPDCGSSYIRKADAQAAMVEKVRTMQSALNALNDGSGTRAALILGESLAKARTHFPEAFK